MSARTHSRLAALVTLAALMAGCADPGPTLVVSDFRLGPAPPGAPARAAYMTVHNNGPVPRTLVSARSNAYDVVEFHQTVIVDEVATMRREAAITIAPGAHVVFEPFGRHLMLLVPGQRAVEHVTVTVCLANDECIELTEHAE